MKKRIILVAIFLVMITTLSIIILNSEISYSKMSKSGKINFWAQSYGDIEIIPRRRSSRYIGK